MKLGSIQFLRAVAALLVAYAHSIDIQMRYAHSFQQDFFYWRNFGAFGVDIFFVISGFIISYSAGVYTGPHKAVLFLSNRFKRVNPVYYAATLIFVILLIPSILAKRITFITTASILKSVFLLPLFDSKGFIVPILFQAWTLSFEWWFYLLFFCTIFLHIRYRDRTLLLLIATLVLTGFFLKGADYRLRFLTNPILLEFLLGVGLHACYKKVTLPKRVSFLFLLAAVGICAFGIINGLGAIADAKYTIDGSLSLVRFFRWGIPAGLLVTGCVFLEKGRSLSGCWNNPVTTLLGEASYSLYLVNNMIYLMCGFAYRQWGIFLNPDLAIILQWLVAIAGSLIFYQWVEAPLLRLFRRPARAALTTFSPPSGEADQASSTRLFK